MGTAPLRRGRRERPGGRSGVPRPGGSWTLAGSSPFSGQVEGPGGESTALPPPVPSRVAVGAGAGPESFAGSSAGKGTVLFQDERLRLLSSSQMGSLNSSETMSQILKS